MSKLKPDISALEASISGKQNALGVIGTYEAVLEEFLQKNDVKRQAYYSGAFVGNHVYTCLKNCREISKVMLRAHMPGLSRALRNVLPACIGFRCR